MKILLIEDNVAEIPLIEEMLGRSAPVDLHFRHAQRLTAGLDMLAQEAFDVLLLDLSLPESHGLETVTRVRERFQQIPIVVLTGLADPDLDMQVLQAGAQDYLIKGEVTSSLLARALRYAIERKRMADEQERLVEKLQEALASIRTLHGLLPICSSCRKVRNDNGYWQLLENYITDHSEAQFSHGICPDCMDRLYPGYRERISRRSADSCEGDPEKQHS